MEHARHAAATMPLTEARPGQRVRITTVDGGQGLRSRLCAMGLTPGQSADVVSAGSGPVILSVLGGRLVLGHGMAAQVHVRAVAGAAR